MTHTIAGLDHGRILPQTRRSKRWGRLAAQARRVTFSRNLWQRLYPVDPPSLAAGAVFESVVTVPRGAYLMGLSGTSDQAEGFEIEVVDQISGGLSVSPLRSQFINNAATPAGMPYPFRPFFLPNPRVIASDTELGRLTVRVRNLAPVAAVIQPVLICAEPYDAIPTIAIAESTLALAAVRDNSSSPAGIRTTSVAAGSVVSDQSTIADQAIEFIAAGFNLLLPGSGERSIRIHGMLIAFDQPVNLTLWAGVLGGAGNRKLGGTLPQITQVTHQLVSGKVYHTLRAGESLIAQTDVAAVAGGIVYYEVI
jgi:hypothetical protein